MAGIDGGLSALAVILKFYDIKKGGIEIALDDESALNERQRCISSYFTNFIQSSSRY